jgi:hypothetical protein
MLPVNRRAIFENELASDGIMVNDIGQIVSDGGDINTAQNIMAGYNASKVDADTFKKRRKMIEDNMKDPVQKAAKLKALAEAEAIMLGTAKKRTDMIFDDKSLQKDPDYVSFDEELNINNIINQEKENDENSEIPSFITDDTILGPGKGINAYPGMGITSTYTPSPGDLGYIAPTAPKTSGSILADKKINKIDDYINIGGQDNDKPAPTAPKKTSQGLTTSQFQAFKGSNKTPSYGTGSGGLGDYQIQPSKPTKSLKTTKPGTGGGADSGNNNSGGGTHCCTAANERGDMTLTEVKKLRAWHRKQSKIWQKGYDVWGKVIADNLVAKFKWQSDRVRDFYNHKIYGKRTIGSIYADIVIYPMSMIIGSILTVMPPILGYQENKRHG